jgi:glycosyltransferase involved in cell wall biosynthesis
MLLNFNLDSLKLLFKNLEVVKLIEKENCDFIVYPSQDHLSFLLNTPSVVAIHDLMHRYESHFSEYSKGEIYRRNYVYKLICQNAKLILSDSNVGASHIIESYAVKPSRIKVLPFIPPTYFDKCNLVDLQVRYNINNDFIFYPAAFWEHKNHKNLLLAFKKVLLHFPNLILILVGAKKNYYSVIKEMISSLDIDRSVLILDYVDNDTIFTLYKKCRLMVYVSLLGPTNIPPIEAIYLNCPLVCSDVYAMPEQVGDYGVLVNAKEYEEIFSGIMKILISEENFAKSSNNNLQRIENMQIAFKDTIRSLTQFEC